MTKRLPNRSEEGMALLLSMIFLIAMAMALATLVTRVHNQVRQVQTYTDFSDALMGAEAAIAAARGELSEDEGFADNDGDGLVGVDPNYDLTGPTPFFGDAAVTPLTLNANPQVEFFAVTYPWGSDNIDNNNDGTVDEPAEDGYLSVYGFGRTPTATRRIEVVLERMDINVWQNAIFAGAGQSGNLINGNVAIHGSVHLLGTNLDDADISIAALDLSGTSLIHNNYVGIPGGLESRVPALPTTTFDGETVDTLNAVLRVKNGLVGMSGNSEVGEPHQTGNDIKETMDGIYNNDGWTGNSLDANGEPINAFSDNGVNEEYDVGDGVPFPTYSNDGGRNHLQYYLETGPVAQGLHHVYNGDMTISADDHYYWNATTGAEVTNDGPGVGAMPDTAALQTLINNKEFFVWFDADNDRMVVNGRIPIDGDLAIERGSGNDRTINYSGKGTMLTYDSSGTGSHGDVSIETNLYTVNMNGTTNNSFPHNNLLGIMAERDLVLGSNSQLELMGGFYAQDTISMNKQTILMGTIVGDNFDMGSNVPEIYQVPDLPDAWESRNRMIGSEPIWFYSPVSWREIGVT